MSISTSKCRLCDTCDGTGCIGELPGMGGVHNNRNFQLNCDAWKKLAYPKHYVFDKPFAKIRLAPMTGATENIGYQNEESFYFDIIEAVAEAGIKLSIGDGCPDLKLQSGIKAVEKRQITHPSTKAAVFIKPYENKRIFERFEWSKSVAQIIGIDIDSYNILTMRNLVQLEKKTASQLTELKKNICVPFAVKGVFTHEDIDLMKEVKPDIIIISNHGGRIDTAVGSTADFLVQYGDILRNYCSELWVDGGIRTPEDVALATAYGASEVMIGRPFASALCAGGKQQITEFARQFQVVQ